MTVGSGGCSGSISEFIEGTKTINVKVSTLAYVSKSVSPITQLGYYNFLNSSNEVIGFVTKRIIPYVATYSVQMCSIDVTYHPTIETINGLVVGDIVAITMNCPYAIRTQGYTDGVNDVKGEIRFVGSIESIVDNVTTINPIIFPIGYSSGNVATESIIPIQILRLEKVDYFY